MSGRPFLCPFILVLINSWITLNRTEVFVTAESFVSEILQQQRNWIYKRSTKSMFSYIVLHVRKKHGITSERIILSHHWSYFDTIYGNFSPATTIQCDISSLCMNVIKCSLNLCNLTDSNRFFTVFKSLLMQTQYFLQLTSKSFNWQNMRWLLGTIQFTVYCKH